MGKEEREIKPQVRDLRNGDWYWANKLILESPYLTTGAKLVYSALAYFANNETQKAYPSIETISRLASLNKSTVIKGIRQLEKYHFLGVKKSGGKVNHYTLLRLTDSIPVGKSNQSNIRNGGSKIGNGVVVNKETNNTNLTKLNNNNGFKNFKNERRVIPVGNPPKIYPKNLQRLKELKKPFLEKSKIPT